MGSQTMTSQGGGGGGGPHRTDSHIQNLARQGSLYSLTLNEVQTHLSEPLLSMNLDELLKSIFPEGTAESELSPPRPVMATGLRPDPSNGFGSGLPRQGSITMPPALSKKTVDEVWRGISGQEDNKNGDDQWGEMTLESFLIKAGVVVEEYGKDVNTAFTGNSNTVTVAQSQPRGMQWFSSGLGSYMPGQMGHSVNVGGMGPGTVIDAMYPSGGRWEEMETPGRKRTCGAGSGPSSASGEVGDKTMERRQKRMIKNRESAARSRARKQVLL